MVGRNQQCSLWFWLTSQHDVRLLRLELCLRHSDHIRVCHCAVLSCPSEHAQSASAAGLGKKCQVVQGSPALPSWLATTRRQKVSEKKVKAQGNFPGKQCSRLAQSVRFRDGTGSLSADPVTMSTNSGIRPRNSGKLLYFFPIFVTTSRFHGWQLASIKLTQELASIKLKMFRQQKIFLRHDFHTIFGAFW